MPKTRTSLTSESRKGLTPRGKSKHTLVLDAIREASLEGFENDDAFSDVENRNRAEQAFFRHLVNKAKDPNDKDSGLCTKLLTERGWSALKPSSEPVHFEFDKDAPAHVQAAQVMAAVSGGHLPPDIGATCIAGIKALIDIETSTEIKERLEKLEALLNGE